MQFPQDIIFPYLHFVISFIKPFNNLLEVSKSEYLQLCSIYIHYHNNGFIIATKDSIHQLIPIL